MDTEPNFVDIGTFAILLPAYLLLKPHIKRLPIPSSDIDSGIRIGYIYKDIIVKRDFDTAKSIKIGFFVK